MHSRKKKSLRYSSYLFSGGANGTYLRLWRWVFLFIGNVTAYLTKMQRSQLYSGQPRAFDVRSDSRCSAATRGGSLAHQKDQQRSDGNAMGDRCTSTRRVDDARPNSDEQEIPKRAIRNSANIYPNSQRRHEVRLPPHYLVSFACV